MESREATAVRNGFSTRRIENSLLLADRPDTENDEARRAGVQMEGHCEAEPSSAAQCSERSRDVLLDFQLKPPLPAKGRNPWRTIHVTMQLPTACEARQHDSDESQALSM